MIKLLLFLLLFEMTTVVAQEGEESMSQPKHYFVKLIGTRPNWPDNMTADEEKIMSAHFMYLKKLVHDRKVITAGPVFDPIFGLIILQVESKDEALEIMSKEPSVVGGLHTYEMAAMRLSLLCENRPTDRYVENPTDKALSKETIVNASIDDVWKMWTTTDGVQSFFAPNAKVELYVGGPFEIYFDMSQPYGKRGSEPCQILSYLPKKMLSFEWNAPPSFGELRDIHTIVVVQFDTLDNGQVKVTLTHHGWGEGENWQSIYDYFDSAWDWVLANFAKQFE